ncbi:MAG: hypothetical protein WCI91_00050 [Candidatus Nomurabacteria bacterium]
MFNYYFIILLFLDLFINKNENIQISKNDTLNSQQNEINSFKKNSEVLKNDKSIINTDIKNEKSSEIVKKEIISNNDFSQSEIKRQSLIDTYNKLLSSIDDNINAINISKSILTTGIDSDNSYISSNEGYALGNPNSKQTIDSFNKMYQVNINLKNDSIKKLDNNEEWLNKAKKDINSALTRLSVKNQTIADINSYDYIQFFSDNLKTVVTSVVQIMNDDKKSDSTLSGFFSGYNNYLDSQMRSINTTPIYSSVLPALPKFTNCYYNSLGTSGTMNCSSF